jgi:hypothetical protein
MMTSVVNIRHKTYAIEDHDLLILAKNSENRFRYKFVPIVAYNKKTTGETVLTRPQLETFHDKTPFTLYELGTPIAILRGFMGNQIKKEDLVSARKAFRALKNFAAQCYERTIADLCCQVILREVRSMKSNEELVFFVEKSASDKMLGRLASLNLRLDKITVCFLVFNPSDLMTTVMSSQTGKLHFDVHRLMTTDFSEFSEPYPGDFEDSLIQSYFYRPLPINEEGGEYAPMRLDIFAQGLLRDKIEKKKDIIKSILHPKSADIETNRDRLEPRTLLPLGFGELQAFLEKQKSEVGQKIMNSEE